MTYTTELLKALHGMFIALCALAGAIVGMVAPYALLVWAVWSLLP